MTCQGKLGAYSCKSNFYSQIITAGWSWAHAVPTKLLPKKLISGTDISFGDILHYLSFTVYRVLLWEWEKNGSLRHSDLPAKQHTDSMSDLVLPIIWGFAWLLCAIWPGIPATRPGLNFLGGEMDRWEMLLWHGSVAKMSHRFLKMTLF